MLSSSSVPVAAVVVAVVVVVMVVWVVLMVVVVLVVVLVVVVVVGGGGVAAVRGVVVFQKPGMPCKLVHPALRKKLANDGSRVLLQKQTASMDERDAVAADGRKAVGHTRTGSEGCW